MSGYMHKPCNNCPFLRAESAVRLTSARVEEIAGLMLNPSGGEFPCHKTTKSCEDVGCRDEDGECGGRHRTQESLHCAGALIFAEKNDNQTQMMRIAGRLGMYDPDRLERREEVFDTIDEMLATAVDADKPPTRRRRYARR